jgi:hypothetical protein
MEMIKKEKSFDAVKMMREIRDKISSETQNMSFDVLKAYIKQKLAENYTKPKRPIIIKPAQLLKAAKKWRFYSL